MNRNLIILALLAVAGGANAQSYYEGFEGTVINGINAIAPLAGWTAVNNSTPLNAAHGGWFASDGVGTFAPNSGVRFAASNWSSVLSGVGTNDNWLMTPTRTLQNGDMLSFWSRSINSTFPDRMFVKMSLNGGSSNIADFSTTLISINPGLAQGGYPGAWTFYTATISGLGGPTSGRFAFNYNVTGGGPSGSNSDYIGVDDVRYSSVPEPATMTALALGAVAFIRRRRK